MIESYLYTDPQGNEYDGNFTEQTMTVFNTYSLIEAPLPIALMNTTTAFLKSTY